MAQTYHKGKYRSGEWCKHLRPYLKRVGNKRWRKDVAADIADELHEDRLAVAREKRKKNKPVKVKTTGRSFAGFICSYTKKYATLKAAEQAIKGHEVTGVFFYDKEIKTTK